MWRSIGTFGNTSEVFFVKFATARRSSTTSSWCAWSERAFLIQYQKMSVGLLSKKSGKWGNGSEPPWAPRATRSLTSGSVHSLQGRERPFFYSVIVPLSSTLFSRSVVLFQEGFLWSQVFLVSLVFLAAFLTRKKVVNSGFHGQGDSERELKGVGLKQNWIALCFTKFYRLKQRVKTKRLLDSAISHILLNCKLNDISSHKCNRSYHHNYH